MLALEATVSAISYITIAVFLGQLVAAGFLLPQGQAGDTAHGAIGLGESLVAALSLRGMARSVGSRRETSARLPFSRTPLALSDDDPERQDLVCTRSLRHRDVVGNLAAADKKRQPQGNLSPRSFGASIGRRAQSHESRGRSARRCRYRR